MGELAGGGGSFLVYMCHLFTHFVDIINAISVFVIVVVIIAHFVDIVIPICVAAMSHSLNHQFYYDKLLYETVSSTINPEKIIIGGKKLRFLHLSFLLTLFSRKIN